MGGLSVRSTAWIHVAAAGFYLALALAWTLPLAASPATHIPGLPGDNYAFLWNFWWMRASQETGHAFFETSALFAPYGADLILHTHTALPAFIGATVLSALSLPGALNVTLIAGVALGGFCTYGLAWRLTHDRPAALVAGLIFGCSPFISARLLGHFNLVHAWTLPLFALAATEFVSRRDRRWGGAAGLIAGLTAYIDYYFVVYQVVLLGVVMLWDAREWTLARRRLSPRVRLLVHLALVAAGISFAAAALIASTGGLRLDIAGVRLSARGVFNPLQAGWLFLTAAAAAAAWSRMATRARRPHVSVSSTMVFVAGPFVAVAAPLVWGALQVVLRGEYVSQPLFWRSSPAGIDAATLLIGHPFHPLWGDTMTSLLARSGIDVIESTAWLGLVPLTLLGVAVRHCRDQPQARQWLAVGGAFLVWALGPHLMVLGQNVGLILPHALVRYVPIVSNARMPGRAIVVVYLALAVLSAMAIAQLRLPAGRRRWLAVLLGALVLADYVPAPLPLTRLETPAIYQMLAESRTVGSVLELPLGLRDGFGERGAFDERVLWYQTRHGRPLAGGFVARLSANTREAYETDPLFAPLLALSAGEPAGSVPEADAVVSLLRQRGIAFIVLDESVTPPALRDYVAAIQGLRQLGDADGRRLFAVSDP